MTEEELFGSDAQRLMLSRGRDLYDLLQNDPAYSYYGRAVGLADPEADDLKRLTILARLQGASSYVSIPNTSFPDIQKQATANDLAVTCYARWSGGQDAITAARDLKATTPLPDDITLHRIDANSPPGHLTKLAEVSLACGVLPTAGSMLRGVTRPGTAIVALDAQGAPVACAAAAAYLHPDRDQGECWWGMLATDPARRGQRLALLLGAEALLDMTDTHGFARVFTGVTPGNTPSEAVCTRMGLAPEDNSVLSVVDATQIPGGRISK